MRQLIFILTLAILVACGGADKAGKTNNDNAAATASKTDVFPYKIHQNKLDNGLNVVTVPYNSPGLAAFYIVVRVGSREEVEPGKTGFAHFFEHMMFRGTDKFPNDKYGAVLKATGAGANANTWFDRTVYHMTGNAEMLDQMFELEADRFQNLNYSVADFKVEAGAVKGEYTKNFASQYEQLEEALLSTAFTKHTYQHTTMGFFEDIVEMPNQYDYSLEFYKRFYRPEYSTIIVVGDVEADEVDELSKKYFGSWERGTYKAEIPTEPQQTETRYTHISNSGFIPMITMAYKAPGFEDNSKDIAALDIISTMVFSKRSDLYKKLVENEQKALNLSGYMFWTRDPFLFNIDVLAKDEADLQYIRTTITEALNQIKNEPMDKKLLEETKSHLKYSLAMMLDNPEAIAETLSYIVWLTGDPESLNRYYRTLETVTVEDVQRVAQKYFTDNRLTIATISSKEKGGVK